MDLSNPPSRTRTRLAPEDRRAQITAAAVKVFAGRDPSAVTFEEIAEAAGVSRALVYNYFGDRSGLVGAVCLECYSLLDNAIAPAFDSGQTPGQQARSWIRRYLQFAFDYPEAWSIIGAATANQHPSVLQARSERIEMIVARWGGTPEVRVVVGALSGLLHSAVMAHLENEDEQLEFEDLVDLVGLLAWKGMSHLLPEGIAAYQDRPVPSFDDLKNP